MNVARVYTAIAAIVGELSTNGVAKRHVNARDRYDYRSIDDLYERLSPLLAAQRLCVLPRILERSSEARSDDEGGCVTSVVVKAAFDIVSADDGSLHVVESFGEALDTSDKATAKAITAAYKQAVFQTFCIPVADVEDPDSQSIRPRFECVVEPVEGWSAWAIGLEEAIAACSSREALDANQLQHRELLRSLAMHDVSLYGQVGKAFQRRRQQLVDTAPLPAANSASRLRSRKRKSPPRVRKQLVAEHA